MKGKNKFQNKSNPEKSKSTGTNLFLNTLIFILLLLIIFLSYSIVTKFKLVGSRDIPDRNDKNPASIVQVEVLNGCGIPGVAEKVTDFLRRDNFDVIQMGNYISFDIDNTIIIDRTGNIANAEKVASSLGLNKKKVIQQINLDYFLDVSVIIGKDFNKLNSYK